MPRPSFDDDIDRIMDLGFGRRVLCEIIRQAMVDSPFNPDPLIMAHNLGQREFAQNLDRLIKDKCPDKWLIMQREMLNLDADEGKEPRNDE